MVKMTSARVLLLFSLLIITVSADSPNQGLRPINDSYCEVLDKVLSSTIYSTDHCIFMIMDQLDCTHHYLKGHWTTIVSVSLDKMFSGFIAEVQQKFYCDKAFAMFDTWKVFKYFMVGRNMTKKFAPYTRLGFYALFNSSNHGEIFEETHLQQIYFGALHVYYGRVLNDDLYELEDVLTGELVQYANISFVEKTYKSIRNYMMHPLFDTTLKRNEISVSLYHCDPFVIQLEGPNKTHR